MDPRNCSRPEYPRPDFVRPTWLSLNGEWEFAFDDQNQGLAQRWYAATPAEADAAASAAAGTAAAAAPLFPLRIQVPFAYQTPLSGIGDRSFHDVVWYRRRVEIPQDPTWQGKRILLHFGAVDYAATVWVNGQRVAEHEGGHTPFTTDITDALAGPGHLFNASNVSAISSISSHCDTSIATIVVRAWDPSTDLEIPRGKQYWKVDSEGIFYTRTSGIWQTVWLEPVSPVAYLQRVQLTTEPGGGKVRVRAWVAADAGGSAGARAAAQVSAQETPALGTDLAFGSAPAVGSNPAMGSHPTTGPNPAARLRLEITASYQGRVVAATTATSVGSSTASVDHADGNDLSGLRAAGDPAIHLDAELAPNEIHLWSPENPELYELTYRLYLGQELLDSVEGYMGLRWVSIDSEGRLCLNGRPYYLKLVLDQGYWPEGLLTAPSDEALQADIRWGKAFGFNGCRKHQKVEDPRFLYWADHLGYIVWGEMANAYRFSEDAATRMLAEWVRVVARDYNHPCIIAWVPINESWGVGELAQDQRQVHHQLALYHALKSLDPTRFVLSNDGWEHADSDLLTIHDYSSPPELSTRYQSLAAALGYRPAERSLFAPGVAYSGQPVLVTEYGGIGFRLAKKGTGAGERAAQEHQPDQGHGQYQAQPEAQPHFQAELEDQTQAQPEGPLKAHHEGPLQAQLQVTGEHPAEPESQCKPQREPQPEPQPLSQDPDVGWGYGNLAASADELVARYRAATQALFASPFVQGICYTQLTDVEQEINGLLTYDRRPKVDPARIRAVNDQRA